MIFCYSSGFGNAKKPSQNLNKDDVAEALKRGEIDRADSNIERVQGMGYSRFVRCS